MNSPKDWYKAYLEKLTYVPFKNRLKRLLNGNRMLPKFLNNSHRRDFMDSLSSLKVKRQEYAKIAALYIITMDPMLCRKVVMTNTNFISLKEKLSFKEETLLDLANEFLHYGKKVNLKRLSSQKLFSEEEFILCTVDTSYFLSTRTITYLFYKDNNNTDEGGIDRPFLLP